ncbi:DUF2871 family protein [Atopobacter sp. AH10]|uniref:DUF2871 family protein n=1 Tax=Atopobacter sp. AH10 TaxID=2315861 RepID=UPI001314830E|nr:DUF2871 family protein [Atopobacter sp. AH10]
MKVNKVNLLAIASFVWLIAGLNILLIGLKLLPEYLNFITGILALLVFALFSFKVFDPLVRKHTSRILKSEEEKLAFWKFFDRPSFLIMAVMMTMGILIRRFHLLPEMLIAFFYTGLGAALAFSGIRFGLRFYRYREKLSGACRLLNAARNYFLLAMASGVFYREMTKWMRFSSPTALGKVHGHLFLLGTGVFLFLFLLNQQVDLSQHHLFDRTMIFYQLSLLLLALCMTLRGLAAVMAFPMSPAMDSGLSGLAGLSHLAIFISSLLWFKIVKEESIRAFQEKSKGNIAKA